MCIAVVTVHTVQSALHGSPKNVGAPPVYPVHLCLGREQHPYDVESLVPHKPADLQSD